MIYIDAPLKQDDIIQVLEKYEGDISYKFEEKKGMKLTFSLNTEDLDAAIALAKSLIKATPFGSVLYFQVTK